jgi:ubiquilin
MATGQNPNDPLTVLNGPMGHGLMAGFNPFQGMGVNMNDPNMVSQTYRGCAIRGWHV